MKKRTIKLTAITLCFILFFSSVPTPAMSTSFEDVSARHWAYSYITYLDKLGYLQGYGNGRFEPEKSVSDAEFVALVCRMTGMDDTALDRTGYWAEAAIEYGLFMGWFTDADMPSGSYSNPITRELASKIVIRAFFKDKTFSEDLWKRYGISDFSDVNQSFIEYVYASYILGILNGYPDGSFKPKHSITRSETAALLCRTWKLYHKEPVASGSVTVPILLYHQITDEAGSTTPKKFREDMEALKNAGFNTIFLDDLYDYVVNDKVLPKKPVIVTFDDGYYNNYQNAYPILKELGMKAEISIIGGLVGVMNSPGVIPHFNWRQAKEMVNSGHIMIESHSYRMHEYSLNGEVKRKGVMKMANESYAQYIDRLADDADKMNEIIPENLGYQPKVFTYPNGLNSVLTEKVFESKGYCISLTTAVGINTIMHGDPSTLKLLKRIAVDGFTGNVVELISRSYF